MKPDPAILASPSGALWRLVNQNRLRRILTRMLDENEFLSPYGIRSLSRYHAEHPYVFSAGGQEYRVGYLPAESDSGMFGGNSNWRGPIWMPVNALIIRALMHYFSYYGDNFKIECPTGSGNLMNLFEVAQEIVNRLTRIFLRDENGRRPVFGGAEKFQRDPHWRDNLLFYEYFHGDNGAGIGASHQTGWTGVIAGLIDIFGKLDAETFLQGGRQAALRPRERDGVGGTIMATAPRYPTLYQINTRVWLNRLSREAGKRVTLADIDDATLDGFAEQGFDWIWLLSVWQIGAAGRAVSRSNPQWRAEFQTVLPDLTEEDICGSGFAITAYTVSEALGGEAALAQFREKLARRDIKLLLDFVPNHTAPDHPWVKTHPDYYVEGSEEALAGAPQNYLRVETDRGPKILAYGRDPNFPGWPDTLQLNYANPELQRGADRRADRDCRQVRRHTLRHGDAAAARDFPAHLGDHAGAVLAEGDGGGAREISRLHLHGRGLLGPRMDIAATGLRLLLRQAALRPLAGGPCRADPRSPARRPRLPGQARPLSRKSRRAAGGVRISVAAAPGGGGHHLSSLRPALLPSGPVRGGAGAGADPSLPRPDRADEPRNRRASTPGCCGS